jgi:hypothetical protein
MAILSILYSILLTVTYVAQHYKQNELKFVFLWQQWLGECAILLLYVNCLSCELIKSLKLLQLLSSGILCFVVWEVNNISKETAISKATLLQKPECMNNDIEL